MLLVFGRVRVPSKAVAVANPTIGSMSHQLRSMPLCQWTASFRGGGLSWV